MKSQTMLIAAGAAAYGALVGWAVTADHYERKLKDKDEYVEELRARPLQTFYQQNHYANQSTASLPLEPREEDDSEPENPRGDETVEVDEADVTEEEGVPPSETPEETRANLQSLIDQYASGGPDLNLPAQASFAEMGTVAAFERTPPFVITRTQFSYDEDEGDDYKKMTVTYYPNDRVVIEEDEDVMDDVGNVLGWKNLNRFGDESGDADVVFIRNRRLEIDYEVVRDEESQLPLHVKYGMGRDEFEVNKAAGTLRLREEDM